MQKDPSAYIRQGNKNKYDYPANQNTLTPRFQDDVL
jgi:hypothetical protein